MAVKIQFRRDTASNWNAVPTTVLSSGEVGYETDTGNIKIGDGVTQWQNLLYYQLPNVSVNPATSSDLNAANYRVMGRYRLNTVTSGMTLTNGPTDLDTADADSVCTLIVTTHAYSALTTHVQQTLTQFSASATALKQWVRLYNGTDWTAWSSTAHLSDNEVTYAKLQDMTGLSVLGKTGSGSGDPADITASTTGHALRYDGTNVAFGTLLPGAFAATTDVPLTALADQAALSVVANGTNASAAPTALAAGTDGHILRRSGTSVAFGTIVNAGIDPAAAIAYSKFANLAASGVLGATAAGAVAALTSGSGGTAKTALGLGTAAYNATGDFTPQPQTAAGVGQIATWFDAALGSATASITVGAAGQTWWVFGVAAGSNSTGRDISNGFSFNEIVTAATVKSASYSYGKFIVGFGIRLA